MRLAVLAAMPQNPALSQAAPHTLPTWQGLLLLAFGLAVLLLSPKLVALSLNSSDFIHKWMLKKSGLEDTPLSRTAGSRAMDAYAKTSQWLVVLLLEGPQRYCPLFIPTFRPAPCQRDGLMTVRQTSHRGTK